MKHLTGEKKVVSKIKPEEKLGVSQRKGDTKEA